MAAQSQSSISPFIPTCTGLNEQFYDEMQCHLKHGKKICWCVHPVTGEINDNGLVNSSNECQKHPPMIKSNKKGFIKGQF